MFSSVFTNAQADFTIPLSPFVLYFFSSSARRRISGANFSLLFFVMREYSPPWSHDEHGDNPKCGAFFLQFCDIPILFSVQVCRALIAVSRIIYRSLDKEPVAVCHCLLHTD